MTRNVSLTRLPQVHLAAYLGDTERLEAELKTHPQSIDDLDDAGRTPFHCACRAGNHDTATLLARMGSDIFALTTHGHNALHLAAMQPDVHFVKWLIDKGLNVNSVNNIGRTPLHYSCQAGNVEVTEVLLLRSAATTIVANNGDQPMHLAARHRNLICLQLLRNCGASMHATNRLAYTPLHAACANGDVMMVNYMLKHGADAAAVTLKNETPFELVPERHRDAIRVVFESNHKDVNVIIADKVLHARGGKITSRHCLNHTIPNIYPTRSPERNYRPTISSLGDDFSDCVEDGTDSVNPSDVNRVEQVTCKMDNIADADVLPPRVSDVEALNIKPKTDSVDAEELSFKLNAADSTQLNGLSSSDKDEATSEEPDTKSETSTSMRMTSATASTSVKLVADAGVEEVEETSLKLSVGSSVNSEMIGRDAFTPNVLSPFSLSTYSNNSVSLHSSSRTELQVEKDELNGCMVSPLSHTEHVSDEHESVISDITCEGDCDGSDDTDEGSLALSADPAVKIGTKTHSNANRSFHSLSTSQGGPMSSNPSQLSISSSSATPHTTSVDVVNSDQSDEILKTPGRVLGVCDNDSIKSLTTFSSHVSKHAYSEDVMDETTLRQMAQSDDGSDSSVFSIGSNEEHCDAVVATPRTEITDATEATLQTVNTESTVDSQILTYSPCASPEPQRHTIAVMDTDDEHGEEEFLIAAQLVSFATIHPAIVQETCFTDDNPAYKEGCDYGSDEGSEAMSLERFSNFTHIYSNAPRQSAYFAEDYPDHSDANFSVTVDMDKQDCEGDDGDSVAVEYDDMHVCRDAVSPSIDSHCTHDDERLSGVSVTTITDDISQQDYDAHLMDESDRSFGYSSDTPDVDSIVLSDRSVASYVPMTIASPSPPPMPITPLAERIARYNMAAKNSTEKIVKPVSSTEKTADAVEADPSILTVKEKAALFSKPRTLARSQESTLHVGKLDMSAVEKHESPVSPERKPSHSGLITDLLSRSDEKDQIEGKKSDDEAICSPCASMDEEFASNLNGSLVEAVPTQRFSSTSSLNYSPRVDDIPTERLSSTSSMQDSMFRPSSNQSMMDCVNERPSSANADNEIGFIPLLQLDKDLIDIFPEDDENNPLSSRSSKSKSRRRKSDGGITMRRTPRTPTTRRSSIGAGMRLSDASTDRSPRLSSTSIESDGAIETHFSFTPAELQESFPERDDEIVISPQSKLPAIEVGSEIVEIDESLDISMQELSLEESMPKQLDKRFTSPIITTSNEVFEIDESFDFGIQEKNIPINLSARKSLGNGQNSLESVSTVPKSSSKQLTALPVLPLSPEEDRIKLASVGRSRRSRSMFRANSRSSLSQPRRPDTSEDEASYCESVITYDNHLMMSPTSTLRKKELVSSTSMSETDATGPSMPRHYHRSSSQHMLPIRTKFSYVEFGGSYKVNSKVKDKAAKEYALLAAELSRGDEEIAAELRAWNALGPRAYMGQPEETKSQLEKELDEIDSTSQTSFDTSFSSLNNFVDVSIQKTLEIQWRLSQLESKMYNSSSIYEIRRLINKKTKLFQKLKSKLKDESLVMDLEEVIRLRNEINNVRRQCLNVIREEVSVSKDPESVIVEEYRTIANM